jgi:hypothetical protein
VRGLLYADSRTKSTRPFQEGLPKLELPLAPSANFAALRRMQGKALIQATGLSISVVGYVPVLRPILGLYKRTIGTVGPPEGSLLAQAAD